MIGHAMINIANYIWQNFFLAAEPSGYLPSIPIPPIVRFFFHLAQAYTKYVVALFLLMLLSIFVGIIILLIRKRRKRLRQLALFKPLARLAPSELGIESYLGRECYVTRESDEALAGLLVEGVSTILIIGKPGSGKTRTVFEALRGKEDYELLALKPKVFSPKELSIPGLPKKNIILFLDDLHKYIKKLDVITIFRHIEQRAKDSIFIATCSPDKIPLLEKEAPEILHLFRSKSRIHLRDLLPGEKKFLAGALGTDEKIVASNVTPASFILNLVKKKESYKSSEDTRLIMHALVLLNRSFIFNYSQTLVKKVCQGVFGKDFSRSQWNTSLRGLAAMGLITTINDTINVYEGYLDEDFIDDYSPTENDTDMLHEILSKSKDWEGLTSLGIAYGVKGYWEKSLQVIEKASQLNPLSSHNRYLLGLAHERAAMKEKALADYKEAVKFDNRNAQAYYALGSIYNELFMIREAVDTLKRAIYLDPYYPQAYFQLAIAFEKAGMSEECLAGLHEATRIDPDYVEAHRYMADLYNKRGQYAEALHAYRELARINPDDAESHLALATFYNKVGRVNEAIMELRELTRINPANLKAHYTLALAYYKKGMLDEAIKEFRDVLILNPADHVARFNLALAYSKKDLLDAAEAEYKEILRLSPQEVGALFNLAQLYERKGRLEEAVANYQEVAKLNPEHAEAHYKLALINLKTGQMEEAAKGFKEVIKLRPNHALAHGQLSVVYQKLGLMAEARKEYRLYEVLKSR